MRLNVCVLLYALFHPSSLRSLHQVSEIENRSVLIQLSPPECNQQEFDIYPSEFRYELWLSEKGRDGKYKLVYRYASS